MSAAKTPATLPEKKNYPGETATPEQILELAEEYRAAAKATRTQHRANIPHSLAPCRFLAAHAIELYLNAFLRKTGRKPEYVRGMQHNFSLRAQESKDAGLVLREKTFAHLSKMKDDQEYLTTRYGAEGFPTVTQINRLLATVAELSGKVRAAVHGV
ncbi:MAG TPA: hypothetical protein VFQ69_02640 [Rhizomicrobium sp.]|nr:hypothetical protein [Rhizomicrobium sp.]